jgi:hypothetical protein
LHVPTQPNRAVPQFSAKQLCKYNFGVVVGQCTQAVRNGAEYDGLAVNGISRFKPNAFVQFFQEHFGEGCFRYRYTIVSTVTVELVSIDCTDCTATEPFSNLSISKYTAIFYALQMLIQLC